MHKLYKPGLDFLNPPLKFAPPSFLLRFRRSIATKTLRFKKTQHPKMKLSKEEEQ